MIVPGTKIPRVHAFRCADADAQVKLQMRWMAVRCPEAHLLARALREARKSAWRGGAGYDPARHAALLRLVRAISPAATNTPEPVGPGVQRMAQRPSNRAVER